MSDITRERWVAVDDYVEDQKTGDTVADCFGGPPLIVSRAQTIAVLPEALALLDRMRTNRSITVQEQLEAEAETLLRREGVLP